MDDTIFSALDEWASLESSYYKARVELQSDALNIYESAVSAKEMEILKMKPQTKAGAVLVLRFCATFIEIGRGDVTLAAKAIRYATNVIGSA